MNEKTPLLRSRRRSLALVLGATASLSLLGVAACGNSSGSDLPSGVAARVGDNDITFAQLDRVMAQSAANAKAQSQPFPKKGTAEYKTAQQQAMQTLVNTQIVSNEARLCGQPCAVTPKAVSTKLADIVKAQFQGKQAKLNEFLKSHAMTIAEARQQVKSGLEQESIKNHITRGVRFDTADAKAYYNKNAAQFRVSAQRVASHILVKTEAEAEKIRAEATPQNFAQLAKKYSTDPSAKQNSGSLGPITKGMLVPEFEKVAFDLPVGEISQPVKTQYGWHLILIDKVTAARTVPFKEAEQQIIQQQLPAKREEKFQAWATETLKKWKDRTVYANKDLEPAPPPAASTTPATTAP